MGSTVEPGAPVTVGHIAIQPVDAAEAEALGVQARTSCRVIGRGPWPGGINSTIRIDAGPYEGRVFDQDGEARIYGMSPRTGHFDVLITSRGAEGH
ncbi:hypothetical protein [Brachybacterium endophyticum]|nr:hypothetical protein [Brachybacterium endophyticum]